MSATPKHPTAPDVHGAHSLHRLVGRPGWREIPKYNDCWWYFVINCHGELERLLDPDNSNRIRHLRTSILKSSSGPEASMDQVRSAVLSSGLPFRNTCGWQRVWLRQIRTALRSVFCRLFPCATPPNDRGQAQRPEAPPDHERNEL